MFNGVILTRGALEVAGEVWPYLELDDEDGEVFLNGANPPNSVERLEFAILLSQDAPASQGSSRPTPLE